MMNRHLFTTRYRHYLHALRDSWLSIVVVFAVLVMVFYNIQVLIYADQVRALTIKSINKANAERDETYEILAGRLVMKMQDGTYKVAEVVWHEATAQKELVK